MKTNENKRGVSLIVLVITIIVVIIIAAAIILTLTSNNPISEARKATFLNDVATFKDDLNMYKTNEYAKRMGDYDPSLLNATTSGLTYNGSAVSGQDNIYDIIPSLEGKNKYINEFEIEAGEIKYTGTDSEKSGWAQNDAGIPSESAKPVIEIATVNTLPVKAGTNVQYTLDLTASTEITEVNLTGKIKILNNGGTELPTQPTVNIGSVTGTSTEKSVTISVVTTGMADGEYKVKILSDAVKTNTQGNLEFVIASPFEIDSTAPSMPTISINPTIATNGNVTATITKANESDTLEYSTNGTTWNVYTAPLTVTSNLTVYARETDSANNVSAQATQIITNIDKNVPQNATTSLSSTGDKINGTITIADSGSGINVSQSKYIVATQSTAYATTDAVWNSATVMGTTSKSISETKADGTYYVQVLSVDNAGNKLVNVSSVITVANVTTPNAPVLVAGMTPVKYQEATYTWLTTTTSDSSWYNYSNKQWANAKTADGSMWVWIPRYEYDIPTTNEHTANAGSINIRFLTGTSGAVTAGYKLHPAFSFGGVQLAGIWVAKCEASGSTSAIRFLQGQTAITNISINDAFNACRYMETSYGSQYGWGTSGSGFDTHLMKNIEWGAVAYFTQSVYGQNTEIGFNNGITYNTFYTGGNGTGEYTFYNYRNQSTTGNITGVYDMRGGAQEYTAAYVNNGNSNLTSYGSSLYNAAAQYKDVYFCSTDSQSANYSLSNNLYGDAVYETSDGSSSWYQDYCSMPYSTNPFFIRGSGNETIAGVFCFGNMYGNAQYFVGFRPTLVVGSGL